MKTTGMVADDKVEEGETEPAVLQCQVEELAASSRSGRRGTG